MAAISMIHMLVLYFIKRSGNISLSDLSLGVLYVIFIMDLNIKTIKIGVVR